MARYRVAKDDRVTIKPVATGIRGSGMVELKSGVDAGDQVFSPFRAGLEGGARIRIKSAGSG